MTAIRQHKPSDTMRSVSEFISLRTLRRNIGITKIPTTSHTVRKKAMRSIEFTIWLPSGELPLATALSITIMTMARMSSRMRTLITKPANFCWRSPRSSNALYMIVVDDMASIPPRNMQFIWLQENSFPTQMPKSIMEKTMVRAAMMGALPILRIFLKEKSRPREKSRNITPMSAHDCMFSLSTARGSSGMCGDTRKPAIM